MSTSPCTSCVKQAKCTTQWKSCPEFQQWVKEAPARVKYHAHVMWMYREATFVREEENNETD